MSVKHLINSRPHLMPGCAWWYAAYSRTRPLSNEPLTDPKPWYTAAVGCWVLAYTLIKAHIMITEMLGYSVRHDYESSDHHLKRVLAVFGEWEKLGEIRSTQIRLGLGGWMKSKLKEPDDPPQTEAAHHPRLSLQKAHTGKSWSDIARRRDQIIMAWHVCVPLMWMGMVCAYDSKYWWYGLVSLFVILPISDTALCFNITIDLLSNGHCAMLTKLEATMISLAKQGCADKASSDSSMWGTSGTHFLL